MAATTGAATAAEATRAEIAQLIWRHLTEGARADGTRTAVESGARQRKEATMGGYNTECLPHELVVPEDKTPVLREMHLEVKVEFACRRRVSYAYAWRYEPAENRRACGKCRRSGRPTMTWSELRRRWNELERTALEAETAREDGQ